MLHRRQPQPPLTAGELTHLREAAHLQAQHRGLCLPDAQDCAGDFLCSLLELERRSPEIARRLLHPAYRRVSLRRFVARWRRRKGVGNLSGLCESTLWDLHVVLVGEQPLASVLHQEATRQIRLSLERLAPPVRALLLQRAGEPPSAAVICRPGTLRQLLLRGRVRVQEDLRQQGWPESELRGCIEGAAPRR